MTDFKRVLIMGTGPTSVQLAVLFKKQRGSYIGIAGRQSVRSDDFFASLRRHDQHIRVSVQNEKHRSVEGECRLDRIFTGYSRIEGSWDTLILAVTTDAYVQVLSQVNPDVLKQVQCIVLVSPTFGSNRLVHQYVSELGYTPEVISFSTYCGDTRWADRQPSNHVVTTGVKKKLYIGSTQNPSERMNELCKIVEQLGVTMEVMASPFEAETRNISLYVHPALFMNDFSLNAIFGNADVQTYVYKLYPEGPINQYLIRNMLAGWKEIMRITDRLNIRPLNLLQFMTDDNYPVHLQSLSRQDIEEFIDFQDIHQEYLLYIRYTSLLIDPFSKPDEQGKYFDFSGVPFRKMFVNREGQLDIPRMPKEDYYRIKIIQGIARHFQVDCPTIDKFIATYENKLVQVAQEQKDLPLSGAFQVQTFAEDLNMICEGLEINHQEDML
ncbi:opine metallophore biosynthesis dehydrogenase [Paenibacillus illinoisensis]|uniref:Opine metallophore biosynthesis dehydrogenase n=1 Tax=Paenibacillus illinoisensis TaxID=59845 RepID=A0ABW8I1T5_9BACL